MRPVAALIGAAMIGLSAAAATACQTPPNAASMMANAGSEINVARQANGRTSLRRDARLDRAAQRHACWMSTNDRFSHEGDGGSQPSDRIKAAGYPARLTSENIANGQRTAREVVRDWMGSKGHRANILRKTVKDYGVGVALLGGRPVWVMIYAAQ